MTTARLIGALALLLALTACEPTTLDNTTRTADTAQQVDDSTSSTAHRWSAATVRVEDHTGDGWPVQQAVAMWAIRVQQIRLEYGPCRAGAGCVLVEEIALGPAGPGMTALEGTTTITGAHIILATQHLPTARDALLVASHEVGHALGLEHNPNPDSVMFAKPSTSVVPDQRDLDLLAQAYAPKAGA